MSVLTALTAATFSALPSYFSARTMVVDATCFAVAGFGRSLGWSRFGLSGRSLLGRSGRSLLGRSCLLGHTTLTVLVATPIQIAAVCSLYATATEPIVQRTINIPANLDDIAAPDAAAIDLNRWFSGFRWHILAENQSHFLPALRPPHQLNFFPQKTPLRRAPAVFFGGHSVGAARDTQALKSL